jgi:hypothetical protein
MTLNNDPHKVGGLIQGLGGDNVYGGVQQNGEFYVATDPANKPNEYQSVVDPNRKINVSPQAQEIKEEKQTVGYVYTDRYGNSYSVPVEKAQQFEQSEMWKRGNEPNQIAPSMQPFSQVYTNRYGEGFSVSNKDSSDFARQQGEVLPEPIKSEKEKRIESLNNSNMAKYAPATTWYEKNVMIPIQTSGKNPIAVRTGEYLARFPEFLTGAFDVGYGGVANPKLFASSFKPSNLNLTKENYIGYIKERPIEFGLDVALISTPILAPRWKAISPKINIEFVEPLGRIGTSGVLKGQSFEGVSSTIFKESAWKGLLTRTTTTENTYSFLFKSETTGKLSVMDVRGGGTSDITTSTRFLNIFEQSQSSIKSQMFGTRSEMMVDGIEGKSISSNVEINIGKKGLDYKLGDTSLGKFKSKEISNNVIEEFMENGEPRTITQIKSETTSINFPIDAKQLKRIENLRPEIKGQLDKAPEIKTFKPMGQFKGVAGYVERISPEKVNPSKIFINREVESGLWSKKYGKAFTFDETVKHEKLHILNPKLDEKSVRTLQKKMSVSDVDKIAFGTASEKMKLNFKKGQIGLSKTFSNAHFNMPSFESGSGGLRTAGSSRPSLGSYSSGSATFGDVKLASAFQMPSKSIFPDITKNIFKSAELDSGFERTWSPSLGSRTNINIESSIKEATSLKSMSGTASIIKTGTALKQDNILKQSSMLKQMTATQTQLNLNLKTDMKIGFGFFNDNRNGLKDIFNEKKKRKKNKSKSGLLPTSDLFDISASVAKYGKATFPMGKNVERAFAREVSERGVFARFPTLEQLKYGGRKI